METVWALARALGYVRGAAAAFVAAEDRSGESLTPPPTIITLNPA